MKNYLIIFINGQTETVGYVNGILSLDPGHFYLGSTGRTRVSVAEIICSLLVR